METSTYLPRNKYRNSYCASCNSAEWIGCNVSRNLIVSGSQPLIDLFFRYNYDVEKYMFVYSVDHNVKSCHMDSDSLLLYPNYETRFDTCDNISLSLSNEEFIQRSCMVNCTSSPTAYAMKRCPNFTYPLLSEDVAKEECTKCENNPNDCSAVYNSWGIDGAPAFPYSSIHCATNHLVGCVLPLICYVPPGLLQPPPPPIPGVQVGNQFIPLFNVWGATEIKRLNALAITYHPTLLKIEDHWLANQHSPNYWVNLTTANDNQPGSCNQYSLVEESQKWKTCKDGEIFIYNEANSTSYKDYLFFGKGIYVCSGYALSSRKYNSTTTWVFKLSLYEYVLIGISVLVLIVYVIYYLVKATKTLEGHLVTGSLVCLVFGLLFYSLVHQNESPGGCQLIATLSQYLFTSIHMWVNAGTIRLYRKTKIKQKKSTQSLWRPFLQYILYVQGIALIPVVFAQILHSNQGNMFYPVFNENLCFIEFGWTNLLTLTGPMYIIIFLNIILFLAIVIKMNCDSIASQEERDFVICHLITIVKLQIVFSLPWLMLPFAELEVQDEWVLWEVIKVLIALQGVLAALCLIVQLKNFRRINIMCLTRKSQTLQQSTKQRENDSISSI